MELHGSLLIYRPRRDGRLSWPSWLTHSGRLTHEVVTRQSWIRRRSGKVRQLQTDVLTTEPRRHTMCSLCVKLHLTNKRTERICPIYLFVRLCVRLMCPFVHEIESCHAYFGQAALIFRVVYNSYPFPHFVSVITLYYFLLNFYLVLYLSLIHI